MSKESITARPGNETLRKELGADFRIAEHMTEARIRSCEKLIQEAGDNFFQDAAPDLKSLEQLTGGDANQPLEHETVSTHTYNIRSHAKVLGFTLITELCVHLVAVLGDKELTEKKRKLLCAKLVEAMRLAFTKRIRDDGGAIGKALLESLRASL